MVSVTPASATPVPTTQQALHVIEPLVVAERLRFDSWSPDSEWIAYWSSNGGEQAYLSFVKPASTEFCPHQEVSSTTFWEGQVRWQEDGSVLVVLPGGALSGIPCDSFTPLPDTSVSDEKVVLSPDGRYQAATATQTEGQVLHHSTTITDTVTNQMVVTIPWDSSVQIVQSESKWLNDDLYLLGQTLNQGVLYISAQNGRTGTALTDLFELDESYTRNLWWVFSSTNPEMDTYHILLQEWAGPQRSPLLLYHSELDQVEALPFYRTGPFNASDAASYAFSSDGGSLLLVGAPTGGEPPSSTIGEDLWLRPVDPAGSRTVKLAEGLAMGELSNEAQKLALFDRRFIYIFGFPGSEVLSQWRAEGFMLEPVGWSPNGIWLAARGFSQGNVDREALFFFTP